MLKVLKLLMYNIFSAKKFKYELNILMLKSMFYLNLLGVLLI